MWAALWTDNDKVGFTSEAEDMHWQPMLMVQGRPGLLGQPSVMAPAARVGSPQL